MGLGLGLAVLGGRGFSVLGIGSVEVGSSEVDSASVEPTVDSVVVDSSSTASVVAVEVDASRNEEEVSGSIVLLVSTSICKETASIRD